MRANKKQDADSPDFFDRVFAAIIAPIFFNISILLTEAIFLKRTFSLQLSQFFYNAIINIIKGQAGIGLSILFLLIPAIYGFLFGSKGVAEFFGHAFYTNMPEHRNKLITTIIWTVIVFSAYLIQHL